MLPDHGGHSVVHEPVLAVAVCKCSQAAGETATVAQEGGEAGEGVREGQEEGRRVGEGVL